MELKGLLCSLEERLVEHDNNRKEVQDKLREAHANVLGEIDSLEESINEELRNSFDPMEERVLSLIEKLNNCKEEEDGNNKEEENGNNKEIIIKNSEEILRNEVRYEIEHIEEATNFSDSYKLKITKTQGSLKTKDNNENEREFYMRELKGHLDRIRESVTAAQNNITEICTQRRNEAENLMKEANEKLESYFTKEDSRIQSVVNLIKEEDHNRDANKIKELILKAKTSLAINQKYKLKGHLPKNKSFDNYYLLATSEISLKYFKFGERIPVVISAYFTDKGKLSLFFSLFGDDELKYLKSLNLRLNTKIILWEKDSEKNTVGEFTEGYDIGDTDPISLGAIFAPSTTYLLKMKIDYTDSSTKWSDPFELTSPEFKHFCVWKECPKDIKEHGKYSVDGNNPRIATKINPNYYCVIIGNTSLPINKVVSWNIKILKSKGNDGGGIFVGVAPTDIDQNGYYTNSECGWYFNFYSYILCSGPPHNYVDKGYGPMSWFRKNVHTGDSVGVTMNTTKGELSFTMDNKSYGTAYEGIPLDKPLMPCALLRNEGDSVEFIPVSIKDIEVDDHVPVPSNILTKSESWDSITLTWTGFWRVTHYQIEVNGEKSLFISSISTFTKRGLLPNTDYTFRIRTVRGDSLSGWSDAVKGRTQKAPDFSGCAWEECPDDIDSRRKYSIDGNNPRMAVKTNDYYHSTIIGNAPLPLNKVTSWNIKILKSKDNDGYGVFIGVAPSDINRNNGNNYKKLGWYFDCWESTLNSGPPHNFIWKEYGPRKAKGKYVLTGDTVGVMMDTIEGELSIVLDGVNLGAAYSGIPLDKPLVPCVILGWKGDSVKFAI